MKKDFKYHFLTGIGRALRVLSSDQIAEALAGAQRHSANVVEFMRGEGLPHISHLTTQGSGIRMRDTYTYKFGDPQQELQLDHVLYVARLWDDERHTRGRVLPIIGQDGVIDTAPQIISIYNSHAVTLSFVPQEGVAQPRQTEDVSHASIYMANLAVVSAMPGIRQVA